MLAPVSLALAQSKQVDVNRRVTTAWDISKSIYSSARPKWRPHAEIIAKPGSQRFIGKTELFLPLAQDEDSLLFMDLRGTFTSDPIEEGNFGLGYRQILPNGIFNQDAIIGGYGFFDIRNSQNNNTFYQATIGAELITESWEVRANAYLPNRDQHAVAGGPGTVVSLNGTNVVETGFGLFERALPGFDVEAGFKFPVIDNSTFRLNGGYFRFERDSVLVEGPRLRAELEFDDPFGWDGAKLSFGGEVRNDDLRGTESYGIVRLRLPINPGKSSSAENDEPIGLAGIDREMTRRIFRDDDIITPTTQDQITPTSNVTDADSGQVINVYHVANTGQGLADCSSVSNACTVGTAQADPNFGNGDVIVPVDVAGTIGSAISLTDNRQKVIGGGAAGNATISLGDADDNMLLLSDLGGRPILTNSLTLSSNNTLQGFDIDSSSGGLTATGNIGNAEINDLNISAQNGPVQFTGGSSGKANFATDVIINNHAGTTAFDIQGGTADIDFFGTINHSVANRAALRVAQAHSGTINTAIGTISDTAGAGYLFDNADGTYNFNGTTSLKGGDAGIDILNGSEGTFNFATSSSIGSTENAGVNIDSSTPNFIYNGTITQNNDAAAVAINGMTGGTATFGGKVIANTGTSAAISLGDTLANTGGTINFNGGLDIDTTSGDGFFTDQGGTISVTGSNNEIMTTAGRAMRINGAESIIGADGMAFETITSQNSPTQGIFLTGTSGGVLTIVNSDIDNSTDDAINIQTSTNVINLQNIDVDSTGQDGLQLTSVTEVNAGTGAMGISVDGAAFRGIRLRGTNGIINLGTGNTAGAGVFIGETEAAGTDGIQLLEDTTGTINIGNATTTSTIAAGRLATDGHGIVSLRADADITTTSIDINQAGTSINGEGISLTDNDTIGSFTLNGTSTIDNVGGAAVVTQGAGVSISGLTIGADTSNGGEGIKIDDFGQDISVSLNDITVVDTVAGRRGIDLSGAGAGSLTINSFSGNSVVGTIGGGIRIDDATFDAVTGGTVQQVAGGNTSVGTAGNRVQGDGLSLNNVLGDIALGTLEVFNNNGTGLFVRDAAGKGGTFSISNTGGSIDTTNGTAIDIDPVMTDLMFGTVASTNANGQGSSASDAGGIFLDQVDAQGGAEENALTIGMVNIDSPNGNGVTINNSTGRFTLLDVDIEGTTVASGNGDFVVTASAGDNTRVVTREITTSGSILVEAASPTTNNQIVIAPDLSRSPAEAPTLLLQAGGSVVMKAESAGTSNIVIVGEYLEYMGTSPLVPNNPYDDLDILIEVIDGPITLSVSDLEPTNPNSLARVDIGVFAIDLSPPSTMVPITLIPSGGGGGGGGLISVTGGTSVMPSIIAVNQ